MATLGHSVFSKTLKIPIAGSTRASTSHLRLSSPSPFLFTTTASHSWTLMHLNLSRRRTLGIRAAVNGDYSAKRTRSSTDPSEISLPGCDYNHWLIVMEFPKDPAPTREQMIETYLETLATVLGSMEEAKKNMYALSTTTYTGFQCTVSQETSEKFKGLPGVIWVFPDSYLDFKNKDYGGDKYINGEIIPCTYPTYQPNKSKSRSKYASKRYVRQRDGPAADQRQRRQDVTSS